MGRRSQSIIVVASLCLIPILGESAIADLPGLFESQATVDLDFDRNQVKTSIVKFDSVMHVDSTSGLSTLGNSSSIEYVRVSIDGLSIMAEPGNPMMPELTVNFVIPPTVLEVGGLSFESDQTVEWIPTDLLGRAVVPAQYPSTINRTTVKIQDNATYGTDDWYPENVVEYRTTGYMDRHRIVSGVVHPVQYQPSTGKLRLYEGLEVEVDYTPDPTWTDNEEIADGYMDQVVRESVVNPTQVDAFKSDEIIGNDCVSTATYDLAIIAPDDSASQVPGLRSAWETYAIDRSAMGIRTRVITTDAPGSVVAVRDMIEEARCIDGVRMFMLGGSASRHAGASGPVLAAGKEPRTTTNLRALGQGNLALDVHTSSVTSDQVFALLDGPAGYDDYPDVVVGRFPASATDAVEQYARRVWSYESGTVLNGSSPEAFKNVLLVGPHYLADQRALTTSGARNNDIVEAALGAPEVGFLVDKMVNSEVRDRFDIIATLRGDGPELVPIIGLPSGIGYLNFAAEGDQGKVLVYRKFDDWDERDLFLSASDLSREDSVSQYIGYSLSSWSQPHDFRIRGFSDNGIWSKGVTQDRGPVATIGESAELQFIDKLDGLSPAEQLNQQFFERLASTPVSDGVAQSQSIGALLTAAKTTFIAQSNVTETTNTVTGDVSGAFIDHYAWEQASQNLFGDPSLDPWTETPTELDVVHPSAVKSNDTLPVIVAWPQSAFPESFVTLALDNGSVSRIPMSLSGTAAVPVGPQAEGTFNITVRMAGQPLYRATIRVDNSAPGIPELTSPSHPVEATRYSESEINLHFETTDNDQVAGYSIAVDNNPSTTPAKSITHSDGNADAVVPRDGTWHVHARAVDRAGNWGGTAHRVVLVDTTPPETSVQWNGTGGWDPDDLWFQPGLHAVINGADHWDGGTTLAAGTDASVDSETLVGYVGPLSIAGSGMHTLRFRSYDDAVPPNSESTRTIPVGIDSGSPTNLAMETVGESKVSNAFAVSWSSTDDLSGAYRYNIDVQTNGTAWEPWLVNTTATSSPYPGVQGETYGFRMSAADRAGNQAAVATSLTSTYVNVAPTANAGPDREVRYGDNLAFGVDFDGSASTDPDGSIQSWIWDFGDGTWSTAGPHVTHTYSQPGTYDVTLEVTDDDGRTDDDDSLVEITVDIVVV